MVKAIPYVEEITRWREDNIHIFEPTYSVLFYCIDKNYRSGSKSTNLEQIVRKLR